MLRGIAPEKRQALPALLQFFIDRGAVDPVAGEKQLYALYLRAFIRRFPQERARGFFISLGMREGKHHGRSAAEQKRAQQDAGLRNLRPADLAAAGQADELRFRQHGVDAGNELPGEGVAVPAGIGAQIAAEAMQQDAAGKMERGGRLDLRQRALHGFFVSDFVQKLFHESHRHCPG